MTKLGLFAPIICFLIIGSNSIAAKEIGNGGSKAALDFYETALRVIDDVQSHAKKYPELNPALLKSIVSTAKVLISEMPLFVEALGVVQQSVAINYKNPRRVVIDRQAWNRLSFNEKKTIAFHELLGLANIESTGDYHISQRYFAQNQVSLYDCLLSANTTHLNYKTFVMSGDMAPFTIHLEVPRDSRSTETVTVRKGPGDLPPSAHANSTYLQITHSTSSDKSGRSHASTFFGSPRLPLRFQMELDDSDPGMTLMLECHEPE